MNNIQKAILYYLLQLFGWGAYVGLVGFSIASKRGVSTQLIIFLLSVLISNILISHFYRFFALKVKWFSGNIVLLILKVIASSIGLGFLFSLTVNLLNHFINGQTDAWIDGNGVITGFFLYLMWHLIYLIYGYFDRFKAEELKNLQLEALKNETELKNLRSQLNPHFMFNAMNSIRALVDEDPKQAKTAITKLSNILRNALIHSKDNLISLRQEIDFVSDYLALEKIRYEERLQVEINIPSDCNQVKLPPLLIQTLVENSIKHGISKLMQGGIIQITAKKSNNLVEISVVNSGKLDFQHQPETGIGVENTVKRLDLEFGDKASFVLHNIEDNKVEALLKIPLK